MKRILILSQCMEIGGAERALLGLLHSFDTNNFDIDLFLCRHTGELYKDMPECINILPANQSQYLAIPMKDLIFKKQFQMLYGRLKSKILAKQKVKQLNLKGDNQVELLYSHKYTYEYMDYINPNIKYDLAISFLTPHYICLNKCNAKKKIAWIHTDYSTTHIDIETELDMWKQYDHIVSISDKVTESFLKKMPTLKDKIIRIDNIVTEESIIKQSDVFSTSEMSRVNNEHILCSIGRFSHAKNFDNVPAICKHIVDTGINIKWYLVGYGGDEGLIRNKIQEYNMEDHVIILGKKMNPYPYIKACDLYVQPSRYEGKAVAVREAQILNKPVIITDFPTAHSQLVNYYDGIIVPLDNIGCAEGIINVIKDKELQERLMTNTKNTNYSNSSEIEKIYKLMEE